MTCEEIRDSFINKPGTVTVFEDRNGIGIGILFSVGEHLQAWQGMICDHNSMIRWLNVIRAQIIPAVVSPVSWAIGLHGLTAEIVEIISMPCGDTVMIQGMGLSQADMSVIGTLIEFASHPR